MSLRSCLINSLHSMIGVKNILVLQEVYNCWNTAKMRLSESRFKSAFPLWFDMVKSTLRYGSNSHDYFYFDFQNLSGKEKAQYLTAFNDFVIARKLNGEDFFTVFADKSKFNKSYSRFIHRPWIATKNADWNDVALFLRTRDEFIAKPIAGTEGKGIFRITRGDAIAMSELKSSVELGNHYIIEEMIHNHDEIKKINPFSLNTLRVVTILDKAGNVHIINTVIRFGITETIVDNISAGGIVCGVDSKTGRIVTSGYDIKGHEFVEHPLSHVLLQGYQLPYWNRVLDKINRIVQVNDKIRYVGWDIAITNSGVDLIEGNAAPGCQLTQCDKVGRWNLIKKYID